MAESLYTQAGIIRFYDSTLIAIEQQEYSPDGLSNWETVFNPNDHLSTLDGVTPIDGHKYKRVMHSGDTDWQLPYKIVAETPEFRVTATAFEWKFEDATTWIHLFYLEDVQGDAGEQGEQGIQGEGFHIDLYGFYQARPDCSDSLSTCSSCNQAASSSSTAITFMSLGDGTLVLTATLIAAGTVTVDLVAYSHYSNDLITWVALTAGIVDFEARYLATDGTGATWTDMQTENYYGTQGVVYVCAEGNWTVLTNVATPSYMVGEATGSTNIGFLDNFVTTSANNLSATISLDSGLLEVIEQSLTENALIQTMFGDGIEILTPMAKPQVNASDFAGFGLANYTSDADSLDDIQVDMSALILDGLSSQAGVSADGETHTQAFVDVTDLINNTSFLIAAANPTPDTFNDLYVNIGDGLISDGATPIAITIDVDDLSLMVDSASLRVKPYAAGNDGIMLQHLNPDVIWANRGLGLDLANGLYTRIDSSTIGYDGSGQLEIITNGVTGDRLNDNVADNTAGIEVLNDTLVVKVDGVTIDFDGSGQLYVASPAGNVVNTIIVNDSGTPGNTVESDVTLRLEQGTGMVTAISAVSVTDIITMDVAVDTVWLEAQIDARIALGATTYWGALERTGIDSTTIEAYITGLNHVVLETLYNNITVSSASGLIITASSGENYRLIVDANGNLDTVLIP